MNAQVKSRQGSGAVTGGWICLGLGLALVAFSPLLFILYVPLFIASFVLSIVAMSQRRAGAGVAILLLTIVGPFFVAGAASATREINRAVNSSASSADSSTPVSEAQAPAGPELELVDMACRLAGRTATIEGHLRNTSGKRLDNLRVTASWYDNAKTSLGSHSSYAEFSALLPGQTTPFKVYGPSVADYSTCSIDGITSGSSGTTIAYSKK
jgi:hypothetical protein